MTFPDFDPVLFSIGPFALRWYALAYVAGIFGGWAYGVYLSRTARLWDHRGPTLDRAQIDDLILWIALGVILGGRLGSVLFYHPDMVWRDPLRILAIWEGGMAFHGGLIGVTLALVWFARRNKVDLFRLGDMVAPCVPMALFFGRIANFVNGELWGRVTDAPWGVVFCNRTIQETFNGCPAGLLPRHPSQLYEAALEGIVLFLILLWATHVAKWLRLRGAVAGLFLLGYGVFRVATEFVREPDSHLPEFLRGYVTMGLLLSVPMILIGAWLIWRAHREGAPNPA